jgi:hypothetical protein
MEEVKPEIQKEKFLRGENENKIAFRRWLEGGELRSELPRVGTRKLQHLLKPNIKSLLAEISFMNFSVIMATCYATADAKPTPPTPIIDIEVSQPNPSVDGSQAQPTLGE